MIHRRHDRYEARRRGFDYVEIGLLAQTVSFVVLCVISFESLSAALIVPVLLFLLGTISIVAGCSTYAVTRGHSRAWGALGLLSFFGFLILTAIIQLMGAEDTRRGFEVMSAAPYCRDIWRMDVRVKLDAATGIREPVLLQLPRGADVAAAVRSLASAVPSLDAGIRGAAYLLNGKTACLATDLSDGDELTVVACETNSSRASLPAGITTAGVSATRSIDLSDQKMLS